MSGGKLTAQESLNHNPNSARRRILKVANMARSNTLLDEGNGATHFYDSNGTEPLFTFGGLPGVSGPSAPAFRWRRRLTIY